ncbi:MAG: hypothetical protein KIT27_01985 [Legionellales bacterium]|nr:hypothetical protein [Legionellales bacterium]
MLNSQLTTVKYYYQLALLQWMLLRLAILALPTSFIALIPLGLIVSKESLVIIFAVLCLFWLILAIAIFIRYSLLKSLTQQQPSMLEEIKQIVLIGLLLGLKKWFQLKKSKS